MTSVTIEEYTVLRYDKLATGMFYMYITHHVTYDITMYTISLALDQVTLKTAICSLPCWLEAWSRHNPTQCQGEPKIFPETEVGRTEEQQKLVMSLGLNGNRKLQGGLYRMIMEQFSFSFFFSFFLKFNNYAAKKRILLVL